MYSEHLAELIDEEVQQQISEQQVYVHQLLSQHHEELERLAHALLKQETLDEKQLQCLVKDAHTPAEQVSENKADSASSQGRKETLLRARLQPAMHLEPEPLPGLGPRQHADVSPLQHTELLVLAADQAHDGFSLGHTADDVLCARNTQ
jgi:peptidase M41-like protein